jgi:hypothetical protein
VEIKSSYVFKGRETKIEEIEVWARIRKVFKLICRRGM